MDYEDCDSNCDDKVREERCSPTVTHLNFLPPSHLIPNYPLWANTEFLQAAIEFRVVLVKVGRLKNLFRRGWGRTGRM